MDTPAVAAAGSSYAPETFGSQNKYALSLVFVRVITWIYVRLFLSLTSMAIMSILPVGRLALNEQSPKQIVRVGTVEFEEVGRWPVFSMDHAKCVGEPL